MLFNAFQCISMLFNAFQCISMLFNDFRCFSMHFNAFKCFSMLFNAFPCISMLFNAFQCFSLLFNAFNVCQYLQVAIVILRIDDCAFAHSIQHRNGPGKAKTHNPDCVFFLSYDSAQAGLAGQAQLDYLY